MQVHAIPPVQCTPNHLLVYLSKYVTLRGLVNSFMHHDLFVS